jgi:uncharacterized DUF497 family protein
MRGQKLSQDLLFSKPRIGFQPREAECGEAGGTGPSVYPFFDSRLLVVPDAHHSQAEPRLHALGATIDGRLLYVTFTLRVKRTRIRVISARDAHRKERQIYEKARGRVPVFKSEAQNASFGKRMTARH